MANDTMMVFNNQNLNSNFLTNEEVKARCPYAFMTTPSNPNVSDKYVHANTATVINDMAKLGWYPVEAKQRKMRKNSSGIQTYHMIAFQNPNISIKQGDDVEAFPRIILTNSHDGMNSFRFMIGLFRLVCSNGLIIADENLENLVIRHIHYTFDDLRNLVNKTITDLPEYIKIVNRMKARHLSKVEQYNFAIDALKIRKNINVLDESFAVCEKTLQDILSPLRDEDADDSLWTVFNVVQEKMIKGGAYVEAGKENKLRKMRPVKSFVRDLSVNYKMFDIAREYLDAA